MNTPRLAYFIGLLLAAAAPAFGQTAVSATTLTASGATTLNNTLTVSGVTTISNNLNVTGAIDSDTNQFTFGTQGTSYGAGFIYTPSVSTDTFKFSLNYNPASWLWVHNTSVPAMRLDSSHNLLLYPLTANLTTPPSISLFPATSSAGATLSLGNATGAQTTAPKLTLGSATLSSVGTTSALSTNGALTVTGNLTNTSGLFSVTNSALTTSGNIGELFAPNLANGNRVALMIGKANAANQAAYIGFIPNATANQSLLTLGQFGANELMTIRGDGNVGIGTSTPGVKLDVAGSARFTAGGTFGYTANVGANNGLILGTGVTKATAPSGGQGSIQINSNDATNPLQGWISLMTDPTAANRRLAIGTVEQNVGWRNITLAESGGNVGIGTASPGNKMHVLAGGFAGDGLKIEGNATNQYPNLTLAAIGSASPRSWTMSVRGGSAGQFNLDDGTAGLTRLAIDSAGNVGIGTSGPTVKLDVTNTAAGDVEVARFLNPNIGVGNYGYINVGGTDSQFSGAFLGFQKTGTGTGIASLGVRGSGGTISINQLGHVGIATTTPGLTLDVNGPVRSTSGSIDVRLQAGAAGAAGVGSFSNDPLLLISAGTEKARITTAGNVGIGTISPASRLDVVGDGSNAVVISARSRQTNAYLDLFTGVADDAVGEFSFERVGANAGNIYIGGNATGNISFRSGGYASKMVINPAGNVSLNYGQLLLVPGSGSVATDGNYGVYWQSNGLGAGAPDYGIYRTSGPWTANTYQQLKMRFDTGIVIDGGSLYGRSGTVLQPNGGNVGIGTSTPVTKLTLQDTQTELSMGLNADPTTYNRFGFNTSYQGYWTQNAYWTGSQWNYVNAGGYNGAAVKLQEYYGTFQIDTATPGGANPVPWNTRFYVANNGYIGIGTTAPSHLLAVKGTIRANEVIVDTGWADYVFDESYALAPLSDVEAHIKAKKHLPGIPSAAEIAEHGVSMGDMQSKLLSKIEELTLHMIKQEKEMAALKAQNASFQQQLGQLKAAANPDL